MEVELESPRFTSMLSTSSEAETPGIRHVPWRDRGPLGMLPPIVFDICRLRRRQWYTAEALRASIDKKLLTLLSQAYAHVTYYRELFDNAHVTPNDLKGAEDLDALPITEKNTFQTRALKDMTDTTADLDRCKTLLTSGSTGRPLTVYVNRREDYRMDAVWAFAFLENGQKLWDRWADFHSFTAAYDARWFEKFGVWRTVHITALSDPSEQVSILQQIRPDIIKINPDNLPRLISVIQRKGIRDIKPRLVFTMGGLLDKQVRVLTEETLGAEVFDVYGSAELGCIAWECSMHKGYHINTDSVVLEIVDANGRKARSGERGRIVCTGLIASTMPFIRYCIGDVGVLDDRLCPCGRGLPMLSSLEGRADDFFILRDGTEIAPTIILNCLKQIPGIQQFKITQQDETQVDADIVPDEKCTAKTIETIHDTLERITHDTATIKISIVDELPQDPSRKIRSIISKVERPGYLNYKQNPE